MEKFPGRGGGKKCAESFGVSPQQWSPWERGMRTPDESRLLQIANFFDVTVEFLRRDHTRAQDALAGNRLDSVSHYMGLYGSEYGATKAPSLREPEVAPYGMPSLRRDDNLVSGNSIAELAIISSRLMGMIGSTNKGVADGRFDIGKTIVVLRRLGDILEQKLREAEVSPIGGTVVQQQPY
jgi:Predicted transcriptional regulators